MRNHMDLNSQIEAFLKRFDDDPRRCKRYEAIFDVIKALDVPITEMYGYACMAVLLIKSIWLKDGRTIGVDDGAWSETHAGIAAAIAIVFESIEANPVKWEVLYSYNLSNPELGEIIEELFSKLETLDIVDRVE